MLPDDLAQAAAKYGVSVDLWPLVSVGTGSESTRRSPSRLRLRAMRAAATDDFAEVAQVDHRRAQAGGLDVLGDPSANSATTRWTRSGLRAVLGVLDDGRIG